MKTSSISVLIAFFSVSLIAFMMLLWGGELIAATKVKTKAVLTAELIEAAHKVLDLGYDCAKSGAERVACHAQLTTAIKERMK